MTLRTERWIPRLRSSQRGAVMIEGIMVATVIALAFAGSIFFHGMLAAKMKANRDSRLAAWTQAIKGCTEKIEGSDSLFDTSGNSPVEEVDEGSPPGFFKVGHTPTLSATVGPVKTPAILQTRGPAGGSFSFSVRQQVACNDRLQGQEDSVFKKIGDAMSTIFHGVF